MQAKDATQRLRFGFFEADIRTGELTKQGKRLSLQQQPFQLLAMLLEKPGELVTRRSCAADCGRRRPWTSITASTKRSARFGTRWAILPTIPASSRQSLAAATAFSPMSRG
jgi:hypothetical protein